MINFYNDRPKYPSPQHTKFPKKFVKTCANKLYKIQDLIHPIINSCRKVWKIVFVETSFKYSPFSMFHYIDMMKIIYVIIGWHTFPVSYVWYIRIVTSTWFVNFVQFITNYFFCETQSLLSIKIIVIQTLYFSLLASTLLMQIGAKIIISCV